MPDISKVRLPGSNETYDIKDATAREMISGGVSFVIAWSSTDYASTTKPAGAETRVPYGITVYYKNGASSVVGQLVADSSAKGKFYLLYSNTSAGDHDLYDEYVVVQQGSGGSATYSWEKIGDTQIDLSDIVTDVSLSKNTDVALGEATTFTNASSSVTFSGGSTDSVLGADTTFAASATGGDVSLTTSYVKATASGGGTAWNSKDQKTVVTGYTIAAANKDTFVKSVSAETNKNLVTTSITGTNGTETVSKVTKTASKLATTSVPNVTNAGSASTWNFEMGSGADSETLIISGANSTAPTLGSAITVATGSVASNGAGSDVVTAVTVSDKTVAKVASSATTVATGATATNGTGDAVVTGVTIGDSADAIVSLPSPSTATVIGSSSTFTNTQPTVALATESSSATGRVQVVTGKGTVTQPTISVSANDNDSVTAVTGVGTATAAAQTITVGTNDKVTALTNSTDISVSKGNA